jgi:hypothetical protein
MQLLTECWDRDAQRRPPITEVHPHPPRHLPAALGATSCSAPPQPAICRLALLPAALPQPPAAPPRPLPLCPVAPPPRATPCPNSAQVCRRLREMVVALGGVIDSSMDGSNRPLVTGQAAA